MLLVVQSRLEWTQNQVSVEPELEPQYNLGKVGYDLQHLQVSVGYPRDIMDNPSLKIPYRMSLI